MALKPLKIHGLEKAIELCHHNLTPRYRRLDQLEAYVETRQYEGRKPWDEADDTPLREREPPIKYPSVFMAIESNNDMVMGEGRWPEFTSFTSEDDQNLDPDFGLSIEQSQILDAVVKNAIKQSDFVAVAGEALGASQGCRTAVAIYSLRRGKLAGETVKAKWCTPTFSEDDPDELLELDIRYPYVDEQFDKKKGQWEAKCLWYRRTLTATDDIHYLPAEATEDDTEPKWKVDAKRSRRHDLGFCPAVWYPFLKPVSAVNEIDGKAIHERRFGLIERLDIALSQKDRAAFYAGDPQLVESGVAEDEEPAEAGRVTKTIVHDRTGYNATVQTGKAVARKRGAQTIWRYTSPEAKAYYLQLGADALKALDDNARDLRVKLQEALAVIFMDPEHAKHSAEFSNKAIRTLLKRQLARCDKIREHFGNRFMIPSICMLLRIAYVMHNRRKGSVYLPGIDKVAPILAKFEREVEAEYYVEEGTEPPAEIPTKKVWFNPNIDLKWGPYFDPDPQEEQLIAAAVVQLYTGKVITRETAISRLPESYGVENPSEYAKTVEKEETAAQTKQLGLFHASVNNGPGAVGGRGAAGGRNARPNAAGGGQPKAPNRAGPRHAPAAVAPA